MPSRTGAVLLVAGLLACCWTSSALAQTLPAFEQLGVRTAPTFVAAYAGWTAWSEYTAGSRRFRLVVRRPDGRLVRPRVASRPVSFDLDLGRGSRGAPTLVYSRCQHDAAVQPIPLQRSFGRGCRLVALRAGSSRERPVTPTLGSVDHPAIWGGRVVYARHRGRRTSVVARSARTGATRSLYRTTGLVTRLDLHGRRALYNTYVAKQGSQLRTQVIGERSRVRDSQPAGDSGLGYVVGASLSGSRAAWLPIRLSTSGSVGELTIIDLGSNSKRTVGTSALIGDIALDGDQLIVDLGPGTRQEVTTTSCTPPPTGETPNCIARQRIAPGPPGQARASRRGAQREPSHRALAGTGSLSAGRLRPRAIRW